MAAAFIAHSHHSLLFFVGDRPIRLWRMRVLGPRDGIRAVYPAAEVDESAALGAERERRQVSERGDFVGLRTDRAFAPDHVVVPVDAGGVFVSLLGDDEDESVEGFDSAGLSAAAPFLYESLR
jgi:hypothetical protein